MYKEYTSAYSYMRQSFLIFDFATSLLQMSHLNLTVYFSERKPRQRERI
jgi:hypothetical protein